MYWKKYIAAYTNLILPFPLSFHTANPSVYMSSRNIGSLSPKPSASFSLVSISFIFHRGNALKASPLNLGIDFYIMVRFILITEIIPAGVLYMKGGLSFENRRIRRDE